MKNEIDKDKYLKIKVYILLSILILIVIGESIFHIHILEWYNMENEIDKDKQNVLTANDLLGINPNEDEKFKFAKTLYNGIKTITDIPAMDIKKILRIYIFADACKRYEVNKKNSPSEIIYEVLDNYYNLRISSKREGRKEAIQFLTSQHKDEEEKKGLLGRMLRG